MTKNEKGFTLIEMLIVLTIITVLIILIVPNLTDRSEAVHEEGCEALRETVQAQVSAYQLENGKLPSSLSTLERSGFISKDQQTCKNGKNLTLTGGKVKIAK
ncbi:competence type IV pilus major pilin ComGC [Pseudogracilibacillus sp. SO30301A]|uniref:competence type IV pilus major pilin ComGC n=1 Tax=Pseudogracilibacillus sp. SO30301A TaxID=3098291 RepID=UPI00300E6B79